MPLTSKTSGRKATTRAVPRPASSSRIVGEGAMAKLVREFDWSKTPVGAVETWSDTLLTTVNLLLASRHPMFLWWGPDLIQFYNDGYRPSLRSDKHPSALGQGGAECWPEIWPIIGPQIEAVMGEGQSTWNTNQLVPINRSGKLEEVFWTYSYSPVRDETGIVRGTLVVCSETTEHVLSERRLRALLAITSDALENERASESNPLLSFARAIVAKLMGNAADLPFATMFLLTKEEVVEAGYTAGAKELCDFSRWPLAKAVHSGSAVLVEDLKKHFGDLIFPPWPEPVTRAFLLPLPIAGSPAQAVVVFGISPRLPFDHSYRTFFELMGSRIAGLLQSEFHKLEIAQAAIRFSRLAEANPFGTVIGDLKGVLNYVNPSLLKTLGYSEKEVSAGEVRWDRLTPPEFADDDARAVEQLRERGRCDVYEKVYIAKDGRRIPILVGAAAIDAAANEPEIAAFVTDLTPLKAAQEALRSANEELEKKVAQRTAALESEISDRKRAEISLRELTGRLLLTQDEERRHMARELHDHAGQTLVAMTLNLSALLDLVRGQDSPVINLVEQSQQLSDGLSKEIRTLSYLLHPPLLDEAGLKSALQWYVEGFSKRSGIVVELELPSDSRRIPKALELVVFRIVQESLTNIHRHSASPSATICLTRLYGEVKVEIADRGTGIPEARRHEMTAAQVGVGVRGMEERVRQFGGRLRIESSSAGTKVTATIPLTSE